MPAVTNGRDDAPMGERFITCGAEDEAWRSVHGMKKSMLHMQRHLDSSAQPDDNQRQALIGLTGIDTVKVRRFNLPVSLVAMRCSLAAVIVCSAVASAQDCNDWRKLAQSGPPARQGSAMAFDQNRGVAVLFGGRTELQLFADTWEWDGSNWNQAAVTGPAPRSRHAMVFDASRGVIVLFGGCQSFASHSMFYGDTWEYDGRAWTLRATTGPSRRHTFAMAYDDRNKCTVLFGGVAGGFAGDTWTWDGTSWTLRATLGPSPRSCHSMTYDKARGRVLLFGGSSGDYLRDTWEWDGSSWSLVANAGPFPRCAASLEYASSVQSTVLFGGARLNPLTFMNDTWIWDGVQWRQMIEPGPVGRGLASMTFDEHRARMVLFGGSIDDEVVLSDTWELQLSPPVFGDLTNDCVVDERDLLQMIQQWGACTAPCPPTCTADITPTPAGDCRVDVQDLLALIANWG